MRAMFTIAPAISHLHSVAPAAAALTAAGNDVVVATASAFRPHVEAYGFRHVSAGLDIDSLADPSTWPVSLPTPETDMTEFMVQVIRLLAEHFIPDAVAFAKDWRPDLVMCASEELGGAIVGEMLGIPHVSIGSDSYCAIDSPDCVYPTGNRHYYATTLACLRKSFGLPPNPSDSTFHRYLHLVFNAPTWAERGASQPANTRFLRYSPGPRPEEQKLPDWFTKLGQRPIVLAALGTMFYRTPGMLESIVTGLADQDLDLVVAIGKDTDPARFKALPPNVHLEPFVPQLLMLQRCDLFISHGGWNSVRESLHFGVPMVVIPVTIDQPYAASRCRALGLAETLAYDSLTPVAVREAVLTVLGTTSYREAARSFSTHMKQQPGFDYMIDLLERVLELQL